MSPRNDCCSFQEAKDRMARWMTTLKPSLSLERMEIRVQAMDMLEWLSLQEDDVKIYGADQNDTMSVAAVGQALSIGAKKRGDLKRIFRKMRSLLTQRFPYMQWYGGFCFDDRYGDGHWKEFGAYHFVLPRFELAAQGGKMIFACNILPRDNIKNILQQLRDFREERQTRMRCHWRALHRAEKPRYKVWEQQVKKILSDTTLKKVVLARRICLDFHDVLNPWGMMKSLKKVTPNSYHFAFCFKKTCFLGASPERLYQRQGRLFQSEALAGSVARGVSAGLLKKSIKNKYEHALVVEAIEAACKKFCKTYECPRAPDVLTLSSGHHLITKFQGQLKDGVKDEDILKCLHPTPALGGTPRRKALCMIGELEGFSRGWYGAPVGYVGLDRAEFVVGIRSGMVAEKKLFIFAGAGIVKGSDPKAEWGEIENKISNFIKIIH